MDGWAGVVLLTAAAAAAGEDWPQWRGQQRDGHVAVLPKTLPARKLLWKQPVAGTCGAGMAVAGGVLVMADHDDQSDFYDCLEADSGKTIWKRIFPNGRDMDYGSGPRATPLIHDHKVYVLRAFGELACLDLKTGKTIWQKDLVQDFDAAREPRWGYCSSPLLVQGRLIVNPGGKAALAALEPETGRVIWQGAGAGANYSSFIAGTFGGVEQVVGYDAKSLGGWDVKDGKRLWSLDIEASTGYIVPTPVRVGEALFIADSCNQAQLYGFDPQGRVRKTPIGKNDDLAPVVSSAVAVDGLILGQAGKLVCLDAAAQLRTLWRDEQEKTFKEDCHLIVAGERGLAFNNLGELILFRFDRQGLRVLGKRKLCQKTLMHPTLAEGRLYVRDSEFLYCYALTE
jgi:outer membrane protein assembly factor BamB